jgi:carbon-monoxide dehydrogenase medium subunit
MKPPPFEYYAPDTTEEALTHLAEHGYDAKALAGGQSLIPMMNFRLAQPEVLIDLNNIANLSFISRDDNGGLRIGAMARHAQVEREPLVAELAPLIYEAMPKIATSQIRSRGTFGGSVAHADPSAELVAISVALEGRFRLLGLTGDRWFSANEFFLGMFTTQIEPVELLVEINIPPLPPRSGWSLMEGCYLGRPRALPTSPSCVPQCWGWACRSPPGCRAAHRTDTNTRIDPRCRRDRRG